MRNAAVLAIILANFFGGISYLWQKQALDAIPPLSLLVLRNLVAVTCLGAWLILRRRLHLGYRPSEWARLVAVGVFAYAAPMWLGIVGVKLSTVGNASILILLEPAAILVLSALLLRETIGARQIWGVTLGLVGALFMVVEDAPLTDLLAGENLQGNLILALHGILWGLYSPLMKPLAMRHSAVELAFLAMLASVVILAPFTLLESGGWSTGEALRPALHRVLWLGLFVSLGSTVLWNFSLRQLRASSIAPFIFVQPLTGYMAGYLILGESITGRGLLGGSLIAAVVLFVAFGRRPRRRVPAAVAGEEPLPGAGDRGVESSPR